MARSILLRGDGSERVPYNFADYPVYASPGALSGYTNMKVACHWHDDWEFIFVREGCMGYFVNGASMQLQPGQGIFVNSRCMHYNYSVNGEDARYDCVLIHPSLLTQNDTLRRNYVEPIVNNNAMAYRMLDKAGTMSIINALEALLAAGEEHPATEGLILMRAAFQILERLYGDMADLPVNSAGTDPRLDTLHRMIGFVQNRYASDISLADIADAGHISKSSCCAIFRQYLSQTPVNYLTHYRMERACDLLAGTGMSVTEIAMRTGFSSQSYFTETFRRHCGLTPTEYRRKRERLSAL